MKGNCFVDTNILFYFVNNEEKEKHEKVKNFIKQNNLNLSISIQNIKEFANIALKKSDKSIERIQSTVDTFISHLNVFSEARDDIFHALRIAKRKNFYDALLVATMKRNGINRIITENEKDFADFKGIKTINPFK